MRLADASKEIGEKNELVRQLKMQLEQVKSTLEQVCFASWLGRM